MGEPLYTQYLVLHCILWRKLNAEDGVNDDMEMYKMRYLVIFCIWEDKDVFEGEL